MKKQKRLTLLGDILGCVFGILIFAVPFIFMLINALKDRREANLLRLSLPTEWMWSNFKEVFSANNYQIIQEQYYPYCRIPDRAYHCRIHGRLCSSEKI